MCSVQASEARISAKTTTKISDFPLLLSLGACKASPPDELEGGALA